MPHHTLVDHGYKQSARSLNMFQSPEIAPSDQLALPATARTIRQLLSELLEPEKRSSEITATVMGWVAHSSTDSQTLLLSALKEYRAALPRSSKDEAAYLGKFIRELAKGKSNVRCAEAPGSDQSCEIDTLARKIHIHLPTVRIKHPQ